MENTNKCPVCGKEGINDFSKEDVICSCCDSDLSIYRKVDTLLNAESDGNTKPFSIKKWTAIFSLISACMLLVIGYAFLSKQRIYKAHVDTKKELTLLKTEHQELRVEHQSLRTDHQELQNACVDIVDPPIEPEEYTWYVVQKGDSFYRISMKEYGTEAMYQSIINVNNLSMDTIIHPGDSLRIKK